MLFVNTVLSPAGLLFPSGAAWYSAASSAQSRPSIECDQTSATARSFSMEPDAGSLA
jgi:hypothetical protein